MIGMFKGMAATIRHLFLPTFNAGYPDKPRVLPPRARSSFTLPRREDGIPQCKSCGLCERTCPDSAITIASHKSEEGPGRVLDRFEIDLGLCMYCGLCVELCPSLGIQHTGVFETSTPERADTVLVLYDRPTAAALPLDAAATPLAPEPTTPVTPASEAARAAADEGATP